MGKYQEYSEEELLRFKLEERIDELEDEVEKLKEKVDNLETIAGVL